MSRLLEDAMAEADDASDGKKDAGEDAMDEGNDDSSVNSGDQPQRRVHGMILTENLGSYIPTALVALVLAYSFPPEVLCVHCNKFLPILIFDLYDALDSCIPTCLMCKPLLVKIRASRYNLPRFRLEKFLQNQGEILQQKNSRSREMVFSLYRAWLLKQRYVDTTHFHALASNNFPDLEHIWNWAGFIPSSTTVAEVQRSPSDDNTYGSHRSPAPSDGRRDAWSS